MLDLFYDQPPWSEPLAEGALILRRFARAQALQLLDTIASVAIHSPFYHRYTPGGHRMSVAMTNCGDVGWSSDSSGYQYVGHDTVSGRRWLSMPDNFQLLASEAAQIAGFADFAPDACLINRYQPGAKLTLHQDRDEQDFSQPIVSVSLGLPAIFLFGGFKRHDPVQRIHLEHGDVVVWGGASRLRFHGILPLKSGNHPLTGEIRYNLTFRRAR